MYVISNEITDELEVKKSKFITKLYKVYNLDEINNIIKNLNYEYKDATHICYAYKIDNILKFSDDGEPGGTAGLPIMDVINKKELNYILAVVIRYFGGIKLGAGGLVRTYSKSVSEAIKKIELKELVKGVKIKITTEYENQQRLDYLLKDIKDIKKIYDQKITYIIKLKEEELNKLNEYNIEILENIYIEN